jgi:hypothetical protein
MNQLALGVIAHDGDAAASIWGPKLHQPHRETP